jgi:hypothetical protein
LPRTNLQHKNGGTYAEKVVLFEKLASLRHIEGTKESVRQKQARIFSNILKKVKLFYYSPTFFLNVTCNFFGKVRYLRTLNVVKIRDKLQNFLKNINIIFKETQSDDDIILSSITKQSKRNEDVHPSSIMPTIDLIRSKSNNSDEDHVKTNNTPAKTVSTKFIISTLTILGIIIYKLLL